MLESDQSYRDIAEITGTSIAVLCGWLAADSERSARAKTARIKAADACDIKAEQALLAIGDAAATGEITRQRELASHYRWRARVRDPRQYGDKVALGGDSDAPSINVAVDTSALMAALEAKLMLGNK